MGINSYVHSIAQAYDLIDHLAPHGRVDLLLYCIHGARVTWTTTSNYRLFYEGFCRSRVPIALVITHLEREANMEDWWVRHESVLEKSGLRFAGHACVTGLPPHRKTRESVENIKRLLTGYNGQGRFTMPLEGIVGRLLGSGALPRDLRPKDLVKFLVKRCGLEQFVAEEVAERMVARSLSLGRSLEDIHTSRPPVGTSVFQSASTEHGKVEIPHSTGGDIEMASGDEEGGEGSFGSLEVSPDVNASPSDCSQASNGKGVVWRSVDKAPHGSETSMNLAEVQPQLTTGIQKKQTDQSHGKVSKVSVGIISTHSTQSSVSLPHLHPTLLEPEFHIDDTILDLWENGHLERAEASLSSTISMSRNPSHHLLAGRALVRARLRQFDSSVDDAEQSINVQSSVIGYIAKSVALVGKGEREHGYRTCDIAFEYFHSAHVSFLLLIKAVIIFVAGGHNDAISRVDNLIAATAPFDSVCHAVQAYMYFLLGSSQMASNNYEGAVQSFDRAQVHMQHYEGHSMLLISLITGWEFNSMKNTIRRCHCEALYAAGPRTEDIRSLLDMVAVFSKNVPISGADLDWLSNFKLSLSAKLERLGDAAMDGHQHELAIVRYSESLTLDAAPQWKSDHLRIRIRQCECEALYMAGPTKDNIASLLKLMGDFVGDAGTSVNVTEWLSEFKLRFSAKLEVFGDAAMNSQLYDEAISHYSTALSLDAKHQDKSHHIEIKIRQCQAEALHATGPAGKDITSLLEIVDAFDAEVHMSEFVINWLSDFKLRFSEKLECFGDTAMSTQQHNDAITHYSAVLTLNPGPSERIDRLEARIRQCRCEVLYLVTDRTIRDSSSLLRAIDSFVKEVGMSDLTIEWLSGFMLRCSKKFEDFGDFAMGMQEHDEAITHYSAAMSMTSNPPGDLFIKRSKVHMAKGSWDGALTDANEAITRDPVSPWGYQAKHEALRGAKRFVDAVYAFEIMLLKMTQSPDPSICERLSQYISPTTTRTTIQKIAKQVVRHLPRVLINTSTGRLQNKTELESTFESSSLFHELLSSITTRPERGRIKREIKQYFQYAMFSHRWEDAEPTFQRVIDVAVEGLDDCPTHEKLKMFCKIVRDAGFTWAWSDTCCIDKQDRPVRDQALVSMFKWYRGSAMVIIYLRGVHSPGDLVGSIWNTRAWTFQEYVAGKIVRFYMDDWTLYRGLEIPNHKDSYEIMLEMEKATGVSTENLKALRPGLDNIREKLRLASARQSTEVEDSAYSLFGIFSVTGMQPNYGEGEDALGRLLAHILSGSGDVNILAWIGKPSAVNSCLPALIAVYSQPETAHLPLHIENGDMEKAVVELRGAGLDLDLAGRLYDRINELPMASFSVNRMRLPCISFKLPSLSPLSHQKRTGWHVYQAETSAFGVVEIKTRWDLSRHLNSLYLVHPWLDALLGREHIHVDASQLIVGRDSVSFLSEREEDLDDEEAETDEEIDDSFSLFETKLALPRAHAEVPLRDRAAKEKRTLQLIARLRRPFGALLFVLTMTRGLEKYGRRVASDCLITAQIQKSVPLVELLDNVDTLNIL